MQYPAELINLGLDGLIQSNIDAGKQSGFTLARVTKVNKNSYVVHTGTDEVYAELTGKFLFAADSPLELPAVGDWLYTQLYDNNSFAVIHDIVPRKSLLSRKSAGKKIDYQIIAANIDTAVVIQSLDNNFNLSRLERYLTMIYESKIIPVILLSKSDLAADDEIAVKMEGLEELFQDVKVLSFSSIKDPDINVLAELFVKGKTYCLLGSSGVGKTTLINKLLDRDVLKTQPIREKDGRGKHTTTSRELFFLENGAMIIDNPGMRELGMLGAEEGLNNTFDELGALAEKCRYQNCTHTVEKGCAVLEAVENGSYSKERYENYIKIYKETQYNEMSYVEKRRKDKQFGKMVNKALKLKKDKS